MRGRRPRSAEEKIARGETRPSRVNYDQPSPPAPKADDLEPPWDLTEPGRSMWIKYAKPMVESGQLRVTDLPLFLERCRIENDIARYVRKRREFAKNIEVLMSVDRMINQLRSLALRQSAELGMTGVSRSKVKSGKLRDDGSDRSQVRKRFFGVIDGGKKQD